MKTIKTALGVLAITTSIASAGGIDRSGQFMSVLFEKGNYAELSFGTVSPSVSGVSVAGLGSRPSGDMTKSYLQLGAAYKHQFTDGLSAAIILDQPFGADVDYPTGTGYYAAGSIATLKTAALTGIVKYTLPSNVSVYGGLRYQTLSAEATVPFIAGYTAVGERDAGVGYLLGVAYEKPEIALRVTLTYNSKIKHELATTEFGALTSTTELETPRSVNLEFQTGVAKDTLVFGSIRWVKLTDFVLDPANYPPAAPLVSYADDVVTYTLGVGRKFTDNWSGALTVGYDTPIGGFSSNLGPTDGYWTVGVGGTYTKDNMKITAGVRYIGIGDAETTLGGGVAAANFTGNSGIAAGVKIGITF